MGKKYQAIVIGTSKGGPEALEKILSALPADFHFPIVIVLHRNRASKEGMEKQLVSSCALIVKQAEDKEMVEEGHVYLAPPDYHLLLEDEHSLSLSADEKINFSRPSIDVLFESAADAYGENLIGILLTGANSDGAHGLKQIQESGGFTIVQDPKEAIASAMPMAALKCFTPDEIMSLQEIGKFLLGLTNDKT